MNEVRRLSQLVGGGYDAFWKCRKRYRVVKGGKASKKSSTTALWYIVHLMKYSGANLLVVRNVYRTHLDSTYAQLKWAIRRLGVEDLWETLKNPLEIRYKPTGQKILFRGFDDPDKLASTTVEQGVLCWVWLEEAFELWNEEGFDKLDLSAPRGKIMPPLFKQTTITFNPWSEKHWLKKRFFDTPQDDVLAMTTNYTCNEFLDDTDRRLYERMKRDNPRRYAVAGLGEWGVAEGLVFENWSTEAFDVKELLLGEDGWKFHCVFGLDYGYTNDPTAFVAAAVNKVDKVLYIFDEFYKRGMLNPDIAREIMAHGFQKERIRADAAEPKSNDDLRRLGIRRIAAAEKGPDSVMHGIARLQEYRMVVHPACNNALAELASYHWETNRDGGMLNRPADNDNHLMDALRYAMEDITAFHPTEEKPRTRRSADGIRAEDMAGGWG